MEESLKVTIIVPVYGTEKYLNACVVSLVTQTYSNLEIFLVDDESPDKCPEICDVWAMKDKRIKVIHKENAGQGVARNAALDVMTGDYVMFVDSDDTIDKDMVKGMVGCTDNGRIDLVLCGMSSDNGLKVRPWAWFDESRECTGKEALREYICSHKISGGPCCKLTKKAIFDDIRFPSFRANEDAFIVPKLFGSCSSVYILNKHYYIQYIREGSTERSPFSEKKMHLIDCAVELTNYVKEHYPEYIPFVTTRIADETLCVLRQIYSSKGQFPECETTVMNVLSRELENLDENSETYRTVKGVLKNPGRFRRKVRRRKRLSNGKEFVKKCLIGLKRGIKH